MAGLLSNPAHLLEFPERFDSFSEIFELHCNDAVGAHDPIKNVPTVKQLGRLGHGVKDLKNCNLLLVPGIFERKRTHHLGVQQLSHRFQQHKDTATRFLTRVCKLANLKAVSIFGFENNVPYLGRILLELKFSIRHR
jgi:hypothetical protein